MFPLIIIFYFFFLNLQKQKITILNHIKSNDELRNEFLKSIQIYNSFINEENDNELINTDEIIDSIANSESENDFLTPYNFFGINL